MERLGLGPDVVLAANPKLVYGRMTGWGQDGPLAPRAGHDINYIALSGVLHAIGRQGEPPVPPLNLVGDFGGGGMLLAFGIVCALLAAQRTGQGPGRRRGDGRRRVDPRRDVLGDAARGKWTETRGDNALDSGAPWYDVYETSDGQFVAIGAIEPKFYAELLDRLGLASAALPAQHDRNGWPELRRRFAAAFRTQTRDEWCRVFEGSDACFAPVLTFAEARAHPHNVARGGYVAVGGVEQPAPAPRFSGTPGAVRARAARARRAGTGRARRLGVLARRGRSARVARGRVRRLGTRPDPPRRSGSSAAGYGGV